MANSVCEHGVMAGTHCMACFEAHSRGPRQDRVEVHQRVEVHARAHLLGGVPDACPHGVPLAETCGECVLEQRAQADARRQTTMMATAAPPGLSAAEAVYGLLGWLTSRETAVTFSTHHGATEAANAAHEFCEANGLGDCRDGWQKNLTHPQGPPTDHEAPVIERPAGQSV